VDTKGRIRFQACIPSNDNFEGVEDTLRRGEALFFKMFYTHKVLNGVTNENLMSRSSICIMIKTYKEFFPKIQKDPLSMIGLVYPICSFLPFLLPDNMFLQKGKDQLLSSYQYSLRSKPSLQKDFRPHQSQFDNRILKFQAAVYTEVFQGFL